jgi:hypothetical protein
MDLMRFVYDMYMGGSEMNLQHCETCELKKDTGMCWHRDTIPCIYHPDYKKKSEYKQTIRKEVLDELEHWLYKNYDHPLSISFGSVKAKIEELRKQEACRDE